MKKGMPTSPAPGHSHLRLIYWGYHKRRYMWRYWKPKIQIKPVELMAAPVERVEKAVAALKREMGNTPNLKQHADARLRLQTTTTKTTVTQVRERRGAAGFRKL